MMNDSDKMPMHRFRKSLCQMAKRSHRIACYSAALRNHVVPSRQCMCEYTICEYTQDARAPYAKAVGQLIANDIPHRCQLDECVPRHTDDKSITNTNNQTFSGAHCFTALLWLSFHFRPVVAGRRSPSSSHIDTHRCCVAWACIRALDHRGCGHNNA